MGTAVDARQRHHLDGHTQSPGRGIGGTAAASWDGPGPTHHGQDVADLPSGTSKKLEGNWDKRDAESQRCLDTA